MTRDALRALGLLGVICADVRIDQAEYLGCLNEMFRAASRSAAEFAPANPATAPAPAVGTYNQAAIREMLGQSFGHSVVPARPPRSNPPRLSR